ncbi:hypothetical protein DB30_03383 [Enhygromyxa salina]|uniref:Peptidase M10 metallopeptidase domain-containing protein n=1 Tax=Enhygromyxa salina TaxID=215803 RepID=A0A0C2D248_9BACT|nr:hypothetical protein [Enhygromyxa salina]KIG17326.1 hypothetical protein DB30_03383 [Enhygromyxa salina]
MRSATATSLVALALAACTPPAASDEADTSEATDAGTESDTGGEPHPCDPAIELPTSSPAAIAWQPIGELTIDDAGHSGWIEIPIAAGQRYLAVRSVNLNGEPTTHELLCHDLLEARLSDGTELIPAANAELLPTHQRSYQGPGAGVFVFSSALEPLAGPDVVELRVQFRDCALRVGATRLRFPDMPTQIRVDAASEPIPSPEASARVAVRMLISEDSGWAPTTEDPALAQAWAVAVQRFAAIGVQLELEAEGRVGPVGQLDYEGEMLPMRSLHDEVLACLRRDADDARFVPVVLVPCIHLTDQIQMTASFPLGQATRIPGALDDATSPSVVVVAAGACDEDGEPAPSQSPERHGVVLAHEIGHYLGLHHSDAPLGEHAAGEASEQLMSSGIATSVEVDQAWFSAGQAQILRRHPDLVFE